MPHVPRRNTFCWKYRSFVIYRLNLLFMSTKYLVPKRSFTRIDTRVPTKSSMFPLRDVHREILRNWQTSHCFSSVSVFVAKLEKQLPVLRPQISFGKPQRYRRTLNLLGEDDITNFHRSCFLYSLNRPSKLAASFFDFVLAILSAEYWQTSNPSAFPIVPRLQSGRNLSKSIANTVIQAPP